MSFQQGLSGLNASSKNLEVIGNNIANAQTYGAKSSRAEFADMYATALNGAGTNQIGIGVQLQTVAQQFTQGNITVTENPMDLAINGNGFFQVSDGKSPTMYTRNGQFKVDREGYIVNNDQLKLQGYPADGNGVIQPGLATSLKLPTGGIDPKVTGNIAMEFTLDSRAGATAPFELSDPADPNSAKIDKTGITLSDPKTYNNATSLTVYDAKGQPVAVTLYYQRANNDDANGNTVWNVYVTANGSAVQYDAQGNPIQTEDGTATGNPLTPFTQVTFLPTGGNPVSPAANELLNLKIPAGVNSQGAPTLAIPAPPADPSDPSVKGISLDMTSAVENGANFAVTSLTQDGYAPGQLTGISIENNGIVTARYSNGQSKPAGQVELATFRNPQGLQPLGGNLWNRTNASGDAVVGVPGDGNLGALKAGSLEESNVDLTNELVNMVTAQRVYQANAQTIKTQDQVLQTLVNLR
ncbi:flagellar hook protein FlgE [Roseateles depolymerans]|uniref:Flagellar hook protein FlgE n=1 Tax=Roseateles depolymerans TaxID=76731 RepID=A0A0U3DZF3_9BURK|nr:flagellar hook protein FlgE [Roseateles depolymerans]ALV06261.1 Flagellar basal body and hook protein [Roseateles depolymerans]REG19231.1 flagellar hook protein FlgE [Roseateles depolymerans]